MDSEKVPTNTTTLTHAEQTGSSATPLTDAKSQNSITLATNAFPPEPKEIYRLHMLHNVIYNEDLFSRENIEAVLSAIQNNEIESSIVPVGIKSSDDEPDEDNEKDHLATYMIYIFHILSTYPETVQTLLDMRVIIHDTTKDQEFYKVSSSYKLHPNTPSNKIYAAHKRSILLQPFREKEVNNEEECTDDQEYGFHASEEQYIYTQSTEIVIKSCSSSQNYHCDDSGVGNSLTNSDPAPNDSISSIYLTDSQEESDKITPQISEVGCTDKSFEIQQSMG